jgi:TfoX/Sxy family transcriptional regulator of competence genes
MGTNAETIDYLLDQLRGGGAEVSARKMFGEYGLYLDGKMVAMVCDDHLFVKPVPGATAMLEGAECVPPYPQAKPHPRIDGERWEEADWLAGLFRVVADGLPTPKPKKARTKAN